MFREWINLFKEAGLMQQVHDEYKQMLKRVHALFDETRAAILEMPDLTEHRGRAQAVVDDIQASEQAIRRRITEHLSIHPGQDIGTALTIYAGVHDLHQLARLCRDTEDLAAADNTFVDESAVKELLDSLAAAFDKLEQAADDAAAAQDVVAHLDQLTQRCKAVYSSILAGTGEEDARHAVVTALSARFCRRIAVHMSSIAKGLTDNPQPAD